MNNNTARAAWEAVQQVDPLAGAWQLTEHEMEQVIQVPNGTLRLWRNSEASGYWNDEVAERIQSLRRLRYGLWLRQPPGQYAAIWRRPWTSASPIGARKPVDAIMADGQSAIEKISNFLIAR